MQRVSQECVESKTCTKCGRGKPLSHFWKQSKTKDGLNTWCKSCIVEGMKNAARKRKKELVDLFGGECYRCGGKFHQAVFDLHHINPKEKEGALGKLLQSYSIDHPKVLMEMEKCVMLCSNCHRVVHATEENIDVSCKSGVCGI